MDKYVKRSFITVLAAGCFGAAHAAPTLPQVVSGQATFGQQGNVFTVTNTPNAIINWQSFSVNAGEVTRFVQQGADSAVLNRITGQDPSKILGALQSNGHVFLLNPNGIMFGRDARIDVNGLTASTLGLADADFLAGRNNFSAGAIAGDIANHGAITTPGGGKVFLIAANVRNSGIITTPKGEVVLAAGHSVQLVDSANPALRVVVSGAAGEAVNLGQMVAQGGRVGIYAALAGQRPINATGAQRDADGNIILRAGGNGAEVAGAPDVVAGYDAGVHAARSGKGNKGGRDDDDDDDKPGRKGMSWDEFWDWVNQNRESGKPADPGKPGDPGKPAQPPITPPPPPVTSPEPPVPVPPPPVVVPPVETPTPPVVIVPPVVVPTPPELPFPAEPSPPAPPFDQCMVSPGAPGCSSLLPSLSQNRLAAAVQQQAHLAVSAEGRTQPSRSEKDDQPLAVGTESPSGARDESPHKTKAYCN